MLDLTNKKYRDHDAKILATMKGAKAINLSFNYIGDNGVVSLMENPDLEIISLKNNPIGERGLRALFSNHRLKEIRLASGHVSLSSVELLVDHPRLEKLSLDRFELGDDASKILAKTSIRSLILPDNNITNEGAMVLVKNPHIETLDLSRNHRITDMTIFNESTTLKKLKLNGMRLNDDDSRELSKISSLEQLEIAGRNSSITAEGMSYLGQMEKLIELNISSVAVGDDGISRLHRDFTKLKLIDCGITMVGAKIIASMDRLEELRIDQNNIGVEGLVALSKNRAIQRIQFDFGIGQESGIIALAQKPGLAEILFRPTFRQAELDDEIIEALAKNTTLERILVQIDRRQLDLYKDFFAMNTVMKTATTVIRSGPGDVMYPGETKSISDIINRNFATRSLGEMC